MKLRNTLFWFFLSLFFIQQGGLVMASSFNDHEQSDVSIEMSGHHMMTQSVDGTNSMSDNSSCCKTDCHCSAGHCSALGLIIGISTQSTGVIPNNPSSIYALVLPQMHNISLFRPPIFS